MYIYHPINTAIHEPRTDPYPVNCLHIGSSFLDQFDCSLRMSQTSSIVKWSAVFLWEMRSRYIVWVRDVLLSEVLFALHYITTYKMLQHTNWAPRTPKNKELSINLEVPVPFHLTCQTSALSHKISHTTCTIVRWCVFWLMFGPKDMLLFERFYSRDHLILMHIGVACHLPASGWYALDYIQLRNQRDQAPYKHHCKIRWVLHHVVLKHLCKYNTPLNFQWANMAHEPRMHSYPVV